MLRHGASQRCHTKHWKPLLLLSFMQDRLHGGSLRWWLWVEDPAVDRLHHAEAWTLTKKMAQEGPQKLGFTIPLVEPLPAQYYIRLVSDNWLHVSPKRKGFSTLDNCLAL